MPKTNDLPARSRTAPPRRDPASRPKGAYDGRIGLPPLAAALLAGVAILHAVFAAQFNRIVPLTATPTLQAEATGHVPTNPDEPAHVANILIYREGRLPVFKAGDPDFEAHQPPLYYALMALFVRGGAPMYDLSAVRNGGIVLGVLTVIVAFCAVRALLPSEPYFAATSAAVVGLTPMNINLSASVNNDVLLDLLCASCLWAMIVACRRFPQSDDRESLGRAAVVGLLLGLALLTKTSALVLPPAVAAAYWRLGMLPGSRARALRCGLVAVGIGVLFAAPWWARNTLVYGDPLAQHIFTTAFQNTALTSQMLQIWTWPVYLSTVVRWTFDSFWGVFDSMRLFLPAPIYAVLGVFTAAGFFGFSSWAKSARLELGQRAALAAFGVLAVFTLVGFIRFNMVFFQAQGRYLYTAMVPAAFALSVGMGAITRLQGRKAAWLAILTIAAFAFLDSYCVGQIRAEFWSQSDPG